MLSTRHLGADETITMNNVKTTANGLKFAYKVTDTTKGFVEHVMILCQIAILERIADGKDVGDPYEIDLPLDVADYLPCVLKDFVKSSADIVSSFESIKYLILDSFREAYLFVVNLYPQLEHPEKQS